MLIALHSVIADGHIDDYRARHERVPDTLQELFDRAGIREWRIWRSGDRLFHLVDCDDFDAAMAIIRADPADHAWQADIGRFVAAFRDASGNHGYAPLEQVWSLAQQRAADSDA